MFVIQTLVVTFVINSGNQIYKLAKLICVYVRAEWLLHFQQNTPATAIHIKTA